MSSDGKSLYCDDNGKCEGNMTEHDGRFSWELGYKPKINKNNNTTKQYQVSKCVKIYTQDIVEALYRLPLNFRTPSHIYRSAPHAPWANKYSICIK